MTYATTFSGIGGWELGLNACGWTLKWQCERDLFCRALLKERFGAPIYEDIRTIREENPMPVDAIVGSPPCQPFSLAGKKRGVADQRHLFPSFLQLICDLKPRWVLMEQVPGIFTIDRGRVFGSYLAGLAALGFDIVWHCIPACAVGAPHRRDRIWIVAHAQRLRSWQQQGVNSEREPLAAPERKESVSCIRSGGEDVSNSLFAWEWWDSRQNSSQTNAWRQQWATEPNVGRVANGVPARMDRLKGLGNALVPQLAFLIGQAINEIERQEE